MTFISGTRHGHPAMIPVNVSPLQTQHLRWKPQPGQANHSENELPVWICNFNYLLRCFESGVVAFRKVDGGFVATISK
jgi:hypothetical protein